MFNVPCGCRGQLNSTGEPMGFAVECAEAHALFRKLRADPDKSAPGNPVAAALVKHVTDQL